MCSIPEDENLEKTLKNIRFDGTDSSIQRLWPNSSKISKHFTTNLPRRTIHILVEVEVPGECGICIFFSDRSVNFPTEYNVPRRLRLPPPTSPPPALPTLLKERQDYNRDFPDVTPSSLGAPSIFSQIQTKPKQKIPWSRPQEADSPIPVLLFHHIMREFVDDCDNHRPVDADDSLVLNLTHAMSQFYETEANRAADLRDILVEHGIPIAIRPLHFKNREFRTNGAIDHGGHLISIFVVKNEISGTGAEPYAQAIVNYHHSVSDKSTEHQTWKVEDLNFNFPCLIVTVFGLTLSFLFV